MLINMSATFGTQNLLRDIHSILSRYTVSFCLASVVERFHIDAIMILILHKYTHTQ